MEQNLNVTEMIKSRQRNLSVDILKILSMLMVIVLHTKTYGLNGVSLEPSTGIYWIVSALHIFSLVAVNCFVLISGYYNSSSATQPKKLLKLWLQVEFFSVGIYLIQIAIPNNGIEFGFGEFLINCLPIMSNQYWFFTCYIVLMIAAPYLNRFLDTLEQKDFKKLLVILLSLFVLVPTLNIFGDSFDTSNGYSAVWFIVLYIVAAYLRRYPLPKKPYGLFYICISIASVFAYGILDYLNKFLPLFGQARDVLHRYNSATVFLASVCLFLFFINLSVTSKDGKGRLISNISAVSFSVYLLHDHPYIRELLWDKTVKLSETVNSIPSYLLRLLISVLCFFIAGAVIGWIISFIINSAENLIMKLKTKKSVNFK